MTGDGMDGMDMDETISDLLYAPGPSSVAPNQHQGTAELVVTTADGRVFNLGRPDSRLFRIRRRLYLWKRRHEPGIKELTRNG